MENHKAYIGRSFKPVYDSNKQISKFLIEKYNKLVIDYHQKQHTFIIGKSGSGKSYLAGVIAEELVKNMENYSCILIDPIGIFSTLKMENNNLEEFEDWNQQLPNDIFPQAMENCTVSVPIGDIDHFLPNTFDQTFSLKASDFSYGTLCYAFDLDFLNPQVNLYRRSQKNLLKIKKNYDLEELIEYINENGKDLSFKSTTIEALITKLYALLELGIISKDATRFNDIVKEKSVTVFDLSQSSVYTAKILVNFLAEKLLTLRRKITRMVLKARTEEIKIDRPRWYIPPVQLVIDEAHNFLPNSSVLKKVIKEGRNCGLIITAISQSPDLNRDIYCNLTHIFVGSLIYDEDISKVKSMLPIEKSQKQFKQAIYKLKRGMFYYYNVDKKIEELILVRPRNTLHPASTNLLDERIYFNNKPKDSLEDKIEKISRIQNSESKRYYF